MIIVLGFFAAKVKWTVFGLGSVFRIPLGVLHLNFVCMLIGISSSFGIIFVEKYPRV